MAAYATPDDLIYRFDRNAVLDLASDTGAQTTDYANDPVLLAVLSDASGEIESAAFVAEIYAAADLQSLTGNSLALLKRQTCQRAMMHLIERRPSRYSVEAAKAIRDDAEDFLERLRKGQRLFDVPAAKDAGLPSIGGPDAVTYQRLNLIPDRTHNFYPARAERLPIGRG